MKKTFFTIISITFLLFTGCSEKKHQLFSKNTPLCANAEEFSIPAYKIRPHDRIALHFFSYPELSTDNKNGLNSDLGLEVAEDGTISLPIVGKIKVAGYTKTQLQRGLYKLYSSYLEKDPAMKIEILNQKIYVLGEVHNPGALDFNKQPFVTPLKAIIQRGGLRDTAKREEVLIIRGERKNFKVLKLDLTDMQSLSGVFSNPSLLGSSPTISSIFLTDCSNFSLFSIERIIANFWLN